MKRYKKNCKRYNKRFLQENEPDQKWYERLGKAFTDENSAFNFPIKYPAIDLDVATKKSLYITAGILAGGMIATALILRIKK
jgi:hypothetical protein